jgi:hypothetical protein
LGNQRHEINDPSAATLLGLARAAEQGTTTAAASKQGTTTAGPRPGDVIGCLDELSHRLLSEIKVFVGGLRGGRTTNGLHSLASRTTLVCGMETLTSGGAASGGASIAWKKTTAKHSLYSAGVFFLVNI